MLIQELEYSSVVLFIAAAFPPPSATSERCSYIFLYKHINKKITKWPAGLFQHPVSSIRPQDASGTEGGLTSSLTQRSVVYRLINFIYLS